MKLVVVRKGGEGSGHYDHQGIPGHQGGSLPGKGGGSVNSPYKIGDNVAYTGMFAGRPVTNKKGKITNIKIDEDDDTTVRYEISFPLKGGIAKYEISGDVGEQADELRVIPSGYKADDVFAESDVALNDPKVLSQLKIPEKMYHVTSRASAQNMTKVGLIAKAGTAKGKYVTDRGAYITDNPLGVLDTQEDINIKDPVILEINTRKLNLRIDPEYYTNTDPQSYVRGINAGEEEYALYSRKDIPPSEIIRIIEIDDFKNNKEHTMKLKIVTKGGATKARQTRRSGRQAGRDYSYYD